MLLEYRPRIPAISSEINHAMIRDRFGLGYDAAL